MAKDKQATEFVQGSDNLLKLLLSEAGINFEDKQMYQIMGGAIDFLSLKPAIWSAFRDFIATLDTQKWVSSDADAQEQNAEKVGCDFRLNLYKLGIPYDNLKESHFYYFGLFAIVLCSYPEVHKIVSNMLDGLALHGILKADQHTGFLH